MADELNKRPFRSTEAPSRATATVPAGNDPLAELARLIGQNDPFSEFGQAGRRAAPAPNWPPETPLEAPAAPARQAAAPTFGAPEFTRQPFGGAPLVAGDDVYQVQDPAAAYDSPAYEDPGYGAPGYQAGGFPQPGEQDGGYDQHPFPQGAGHAQADGDHDDYYDDAPPSRRRIGILAIAGIFALAVIGTAGAFGYRAIFGSSSVSGPPPVIKADATPSKIVPAAAGKEAQSNKMITDRANASGQGEKLVSREEQPLAVMPERSVNAPAPVNQPIAPFAAAVGNGVIGTEPKRIRTIAIRPDGSAEPTPAAMPAPTENQPAPQPRVVNVTPAQKAAPIVSALPPPPPEAPPTRVTNMPQPVAEPTRASPPPAQRVTAAPRHVEPAAPANAPLSLNPNEPSAAPSTPQRTAAVARPTRAAPAATSSAGGGYAVQVSARKSEDDAQAAFHTLQAQYPGQLGGRQPIIKRVDLGAKGIYFRAMVGPFGSSGEASELCSSLKAAGGQCIVQHN